MYSNNNLSFKIAMKYRNILDNVITILISIQKEREILLKYIYCIITYCSQYDYDTMKKIVH